jgi:hypothetical protein
MKKAQKNKMRKNTSVTMNKIIPYRSPKYEKSLYYLNYTK